MAVGTQVINTQDLKLILQHEALLGERGLVGTRYQLPILSPPTILDLTAPLESSPQVFGKYTQDKDHSNHNRFNQMFEISFSTLCSPTVLDMLCKFMYENGDGANTVLGNYSPPAWTYNTLANFSAVIGLEGGGFGNNAVEQDDLIYAGCVMKSLTINHSIDNEGGHPVAECVFVTGYSPEYTDDYTDGVFGYTSITGSHCTHFTDWDNDVTYIDLDNASYEIHPYSYSVSITRDIQRVGCRDYVGTVAGFKPDGYVMVGGLETSMSMVYKRDENFQSFISRLYLGDTVLRIASAIGTPWDIMINGKISEHSVDTGNPELRNSITVKGMNDVTTSGVVLSMAM